MAEQKSEDGTMLCVSYAESVPVKEDQPDDVSFITLGPLPIPEVGDDCVMLAVKASSVNPVDFMMTHSAEMCKQMGILYPVIVGVDVAGVVEKVGKNVESLKVGDEVWAFSSPPYCGGWAEKCVLPAALCAPKPAAFTWETCGVLGCAAVTAMTAILANPFQAGHTVLVRGATGGTGLVLMQLLHHMGAAGITAVCSGKNAGLAKEYGATEVIDYTAGDPATQLTAGGARFDAYFDFAPGGTGGRALYQKVPGFLKKGATSCFIAEYGIEAEAVEGYPAKVVFAGPTPEVFAALTEVFTTKPFRVEIMETFALKDWEQAFRISKGRRARGKVCLKIAA